MPKKKTTTEKDMFGHPVKKRVSRHERALAKMDKETFQSRVERLKFVDNVLGNTWMAGSLEATFIFREAGLAYINGEFISTILLSQAFIERLLSDFLTQKGFEGEANRGVQAMIRYCRQHQLTNEFLLGKIDRLRQIRNPFVHMKPLDHPFALGRRTFFEKTPPEELLENDAKEALSLMYTIFFARL
jgi:hypothetical protein